MTVQHHYPKKTHTEAQARAKAGKRKDGNFRETTNFFVHDRPASAIALKTVTTESGIKKKIIDIPHDEISEKLSKEILEYFEGFINDVQTKLKDFGSIIPMPADFVLPLIRKLEANMEKTLTKKITKIVDDVMTDL